MTPRGALGRKILGNVSPLTSRAQHIDDAIHQVAHIDLGSTAAASRRSDQRRDLDPFRIGEITRIPQTIAIISRAVLRRPHSAIRAAAIRITTDSSDSRSFETDTQPDGYEFEQAELKASPHNPAGFN
jgi:hypothetical protein